MKKYSEVISAVLVLIVTFLILQWVGAYHFYYIEQFQLFLTTPLYFLESISHPGGLTEYISHFLVQFFIIPYCGAIIEAVVLLLVFLTSSRLILRSEKSKILFIAPATIFLSCLLMSFNFNIFPQSVLSFLLCIFCLNVFISLRNSVVRNVSSFVAVPLLYWLAGSVSVLFALCFCLYEFLFEKNKRRFYWLFLPAFACLISWLSVLLSFSGSFRVSSLPDLYFQPKLTPSVLIYIPWLLLIFWMPVIGFLAKVDFFTREHYLTLGIQSLLFILLLGLGIKRYGDWESYKVKKLDYYARFEQWDKIITECKKGGIDNYLDMNYLNLALAQKGYLFEEMFQFNQNGPLCLEVLPKKSNVVAPLLSDIRFFVGDIALSQRYAFEGFETCSGGGSGRLLKRLVQTNLIYGEYAVAEKYIRILEHTFFYRKWATNQRKFLYNNSLCQNDPQISAARKCLPPLGDRRFSENLPLTMNTLAEINPGNRPALNYLLAFCMLSKDVERLIKFIAQYDSDELRSGRVSDIIQQAELMYYESHPEKWKEMGISSKTIRLYKLYKYTFFKNRQDPAIKEIMKEQFASTYWFYFQFV